MSVSGKVILEVKELQLIYRRRSSFFKRFEHKALNDISFSLVKGETFGILGRNGCGKSSLLRILAGIISPSSGRVLCDVSIRRALLTLGLGFKFDLTGRDNALLSVMFQGESKSYALSMLEHIWEFSELGEFFDQPVSSYSNGMRARLGFATAVVTQVDLLLIDEVLSVGDSHFKQKAEKIMSEKINGEQTIVFVSHAAPQVRRLCNRALWLENGIIQEEGDTNYVCDKYQNFMQTLNGKGR